MSSKGLLYDYEVQMAHATKGDIARGIHAESEASSSNPKYDIFLSFRGLDTRKTFTDHLYWALKQEGYRTFRDDNEIERGENINSELRNAIRNSKMSVIVLSKNFADFAACLFELETILEHRKTSDHVILPVFYDVDPLEIKVQAAKLDFKNKAIKQVKVWSEALKVVASMAGMVSRNQSNGYEVRLIKAIVEFADRKVGDNQDFSTKWQRLTKSIAYLSAQEEDVRAKALRDDDVWVQAHTKRIREYLTDTLSELGDGDVWVAHTERIQKYLTDTLSEVGNGAVTERFREYLMDTLSDLRNDVATQTIREKLMYTLSELGDGAVWVAHTERIRENLTDTLSELRDGTVTKLQEYSELGDGVVQEAHSTVLCAFRAVQNLGWH